MDQLFNTVFENSLRLLLLLNKYDLPQTLDRPHVVDFMTLYGKSFGLAEHNLNGENSFKFSEFASQRELIKEALRELVLKGTAEAVIYKSGISYIITPEGEDFCASLESDYAREYQEYAELLIRATDDKSERSLIADVYRLSAKSVREEGAQ